MHVHFLSTLYSSSLLLIRALCKKTFREKKRDAIELKRLLVSPFPPSYLHRHRHLLIAAVVCRYCCRCCFSVARLIFYVYFSLRNYEAHFQRIYVYMYICIVFRYKAEKEKKSSCFGSFWHKRKSDLVKP